MALFQLYIIDTVDNTHITAYELAENGAIILNWSGSDDKDTLIVGSSLAFNMLVPDSVDAKYIHLFTANESRYKVSLINDDDDSLWWEGFLLPDQYSEPWTGGGFFVNFKASDGLGLLKGKYLSETFYKDEKNVIEILAECLKLTGNLFNIYFTPAIINKVTQEWHGIYINTALYLEKEKKLTAYKILEKLLNDLLCTVYQEKGIWYVVGINKRGIISRNMFVYDANGLFISMQTDTRQVIGDASLTILQNPTITITSPLKSVEVTSNIEKQSFPTALYKDISDGYLADVGVIPGLNPRYWKANGGFEAAIKLPGNHIALGVVGTEDITKFISLKKKVYVVAGQKFKFNIDLENYNVPESTSAEIDALVAASKWKNIVPYSILLNDVHLISNYYADITPKEWSLNYESDKKASLEVEFIVQENGYLDVRFYQPIGTYANTKILGNLITNLTVEFIEFSDEEIYIKPVADDFSIIKDIELNVSDNLYGENIFRIEKLNDTSTLLKTEAVPIQNVFVIQSVNYISTHLKALIYIKDFPYNVKVKRNGNAFYTTLTDVVTTYNYANADMMVFTYNAVALGYVIAANDDIIVDVKDYVYPSIDRTSWQQWYDNYYNVGVGRYNTTVALVYANLYKAAQLKLDGAFDNILTFHNLIKFRYVDDKLLYPLNLTVNLTMGESNGTFSESFYGVSAAENIPPIVIIEDDFSISNIATTTPVTATSNDPDGFIASWLWEVISGTVTIDNPAIENTTLSGMSGNTWVLRLTVTDNGGATAFDTITITRTLNYTLSKTNISHVISGTIEIDDDILVDQLVVSPTLEASTVLTFKHTITLVVNNDPSGASSSAVFQIEKNGFVVYSGSLYSTAIQISNQNISYITGDVIKYRLTCQSNAPSGSGATSANIDIDIVEVTVLNADATVGVLPFNFNTNTSVSN